MRGVSQLLPRLTYGLWLGLGACETVPADEPAQQPLPPAPALESSSSTQEQPAPAAELPHELLRPDPKLRWPLESVHITSRYGWRIDPVTGSGSKLHRGVDLRGATGDLVLAAGDARVSFSGWDPLLGELIILDHGDGLESWYAHLSSRLVYEGLRVRTGSAIANVGNTGRSAAPHLHLTIKLDGEAVDPLPYFTTSGARSYPRPTASDHAKGLAAAAAMPANEGPSREE